MAETGYYLVADIEAVRARLAAPIRAAMVYVEPTDMFCNATVGVYARDEWVAKGELEDLLGTALLDERDLVLAEAYSFLKVPLPI